MGYDLRLLPIEVEGPRVVYSHTVLDLERDSRMFDQIHAFAERKGRKVDPRFTCHVPNSRFRPYGRKTVDSYGKPLLYVRAKDLYDIMKQPISVFYTLEKNIAATEYIGALDADTKIVLDWH